MIKNKTDALQHIHNEMLRGCSIVELYKTYTDRINIMVEGDDDVEQERLVIAELEGLMAIEYMKSLGYYQDNSTGITRWVQD